MSGFNEGLIWSVGLITPNSFNGGFDMLNDQDRDGLWAIIEHFAPYVI